MKVCKRNYCYINFVTLHSDDCHLKDKNKIKRIIECE